MAETELERLLRLCGYRFASEAAKACFGKNPVGGLSDRDIAELTEWLRKKAPRPNRYAATCADCGGWVEAGQGRLTGEKGACKTYHLT